MSIKDRWKTLSKKDKNQIIYFLMFWLAGFVIGIFCNGYMGAGLIIITTIFFMNTTSYIAQFLQICIVLLLYYDVCFWRRYRDWWFGIYHMQTLEILFLAVTLGISALCFGELLYDKMRMTSDKERESGNKSLRNEKIMWCRLIVTVLFLISWLSKFCYIEDIMGTSMYPTLEDREIVLAFNATGREVKRGQIVTFYDSVYNKDLVKRVIAVAGDELVISDSKIYVNGRQLREPYLNEQRFFGETHITVPDDSIWVMGDNRNYSRDSREFGAVKRKNVRSIVFSIFCK